MQDSIAGENSDLFIQGHKIHVQTEDWGIREQVLVSRVFKNGSVLKTFRLAYEKIPSAAGSATSATTDLRSLRQMALRKLHQHSIDWAQKET